MYWVLLDLHKIFKLQHNHNCIKLGKHLGCVTFSLFGSIACCHYQELVKREWGVGRVPGSILGPLQFSLCINDVPSICEDAEVLSYADDQVIFRDGKEAEQIAVTNKVSLWLLTLNIGKSATMYFTRMCK